MTACDDTPDDILALAREALATQFEVSVKALPSLPARTRRGEMDHTYEIKAIIRAVTADRGRALLAEEKRDA